MEKPYEMYIKKTTAKQELIDSYLARLGLWRKPVPRDGFCLFRAVSEQIFGTQTFYEHLRNTCISHLKNHEEEIEMLAGQSAKSHLSFLEDGQTCGSHLEIKLLSYIYHCVFWIYVDTGKSPLIISENGFNKTVLLYFDGAHYDCIYPKSFLESAALCQAIVYEVLYRQVFKLPTEIIEAVNLLRNQNKNRRKKTSSWASDASTNATKGAEAHEQRSAVEKVTPPLPYRIAKALDPEIFRNVELDIWNEANRALAQNLKQAEFLPGDKCQVMDVDGNKIYNAHIQEVSDNKGPVIVFLEEIGEKRQVQFKNLRRLSSTASSSSYTHLKRRQRCQKDIPMILHMNGSHSLPANKGRGWISNRSLPIYFDQSHKINSAGHPIRSKLKQEKFPDHVATPSAHIKSTDTKTLTIVETETVDKKDFIQSSFIENQSSEVLQEHSISSSTLSECKDDTVLKLSSADVTDDSVSEIHNRPTLTSKPVSNTLPISTPYIENPYIWIPYQECFTGPVNVNFGTSQDPSGRDLPLSDMNTLRFFYNLGYEYYRAVNVPPQEIIRDNQMFTNGPTGTYSSLVAETYIEHPEENAVFSIAGQYYNKNLPDKPKFSSKPLTVISPKSKVDLNKKGSYTSKELVKVDSGSMLNDSSCGSESDSSSKVDCSDMRVQNNESEADTCSLDSMANMPPSLETVPLQVSDQNGEKRSRRKFYWYGTHKLVKPIKEIPPRFQLLLAETNAEKARCEGRPIIIQHPAESASHAELPITSASFNPDAQCFIPSQPYDSKSSNPDTLVMEGKDSVINTSDALVDSAGSNTSLPPTPMYTIHVYSAPYSTGGGGANSCCMPIPVCAGYGTPSQPIQAPVCFPGQPYSQQSFAPCPPSFIPGNSQTIQQQFTPCITYAQNAQYSVIAMPQ